MCAGLGSICYVTDYAVCEPVLESTYMSVFECVLFGLRLLKGGAECEYNGANSGERVRECGCVGV